MKLMQITTFPLTSMAEAVDVFMDILVNDPLPDYVVRESFYSHWGGDGVKSYLVYDIEDGRTDEGINEIVRRNVKSASVEGYRIEAQVVLPMETALANLGRKLPEA